MVLLPNRALPKERIKKILARRRKKICVRNPAPDSHNPAPVVSLGGSIVNFCKKPQETGGVFKYYFMFSRADFTAQRFVLRRKMCG